MALSDGFSSGGGECGSFLMGIKLGTGGGGWCGLPPTEEATDMDGCRCGGRCAAPEWG